MRGMIMLRFILGILAVLFAIETGFYTVNSNLTVGLIMLYLITVVLGCGCVFYKKLSIWFQTKSGRIIGIFCLTGVLIYFFTAVFLALCVGVARPSGDEQVMIVLGAGLKGDKISSVLKFRLDAAYEYCADKPGLTVVVTGGQGNGESIPEATAMKKYLVQRGIAPERIICEDASTSTRENFLFSEKKLRQLGLEPTENYIFVSNRFHCYRAAMIARREGLNVCCIPCAISSSALLPCYLREVLAVWYYWIFPG